MRLLLLWGLITASSASMYFQHMGFVAEFPSYGHIHFTIDTEFFLSHMADVNLHIATLRKHIKDIAFPGVRQRADTFLTQTHNELVGIRKRFTSFTVLLGQADVPQERTKRFIALMIALGSLSISLFNTAEILRLQASVSQLQGQQDQIINILQDHEIAINTLQHDFLKIRDGFISIVNIIEEGQALQKLQETEIEIIMTIKELEKTISCLQHGIETLFLHRLPICFMDSTQMMKSLDNLSQKAKKNHLEPISSHPSTLLQYETSFLLIKGIIHVYVHVPLIEKPRVMDVLRFNSIPVPISSSVSFAFAPTENHLAINKQGLHTTISQAQLTTCRRYYDYYFCDQNFIMTKKMTNTCLGSIYIQDFGNLKNKCPAVFFQTTEALHEIARNEYMFSTTYPQTIQVKCQDTTSHVAVQSSQKISLKPSCELSTAEHVIRTGLDLNVNGEIGHWPWIWNVSDALFDIDMHSLDALVKELKLADNQPTPIRNLRKIIMMNSHQNVNFWLSAVLIGLAIFVLGILAFLGFRYYKLRQNQSSSDHVQNPNA